MMKILSSILIVGATGRLGVDICHALAKSKDKFERISVFNNTAQPKSFAREETFAQLQKEGFEIVSGTFSDASSFKGFDVVIILLGNHALEHQPQIIDTAILAGVRHFYPSEFGADLTVGKNWHQRYYRDKVLTREHLEKRAREVNGLGWTFVLIGRLTEWSCIRAFGIDNKKHVARIFGTENSRQSLLATEDVTSYTVRTLLDPFDEDSLAGRKRTYRFHGGPYTWREIFWALNRITEFEYEVEYIPIEQALEKEKRGKEMGNVELELEASHQLVQGREGTLLPQPTDNWRFPEVETIGLEEALRDAFNDSTRKEFLGL